MVSCLTNPQSYLLYRYIEKGGEFYLNEADYASKPGTGCKADIKKELFQPPRVTKASSSQSPKARKRPRRSAAATVQSYAVPGSDDEAMLVDDNRIDASLGHDERKVYVVDEHLRLWIKHLGDLLKVQHAKVCTAHLLC